MTVKPKCFSRHFCTLYRIIEDTNRWKSVRFAPQIRHQKLLKKFLDSNIFLAPLLQLWKCKTAKIASVIALYLSTMFLVFPFYRLPRAFFLWFVVCGFFVCLVASWLKNFSKTNHFVSFEIAHNSGFVCVIYVWYPIIAIWNNRNQNGCRICKRVYAK